MKNVKPMAGQVWEVSPLCTRTVESVDDVDVYWVDNSYTPLCELHENFKFLPRTDLEWLAVNYEWSNDEIKSILKCGGLTGECDHADFGYVTRQQWQNMRYELGLDETTTIVGAPNVVIRAERAWMLACELAGKDAIPNNKEFRARIIKRMEKAIEIQDQAISEHLNSTPSHMSGLSCFCTLTPLKKETQMIDLSTAVIGDEYKTECADIVTVKYLNHTYACCEYNNKVLSVFMLDGTNVINGSASLVSKHDPRHWLKDLPDADLFEGDIYLYNSSGGNWCTSRRSQSLNKEETFWKGTLTSLVGIKMPTLTGDEWKDSKISIPDLKAWQLNKKEQS